MNSRVQAAVDAINALENFDELRSIYDAVRLKETFLSRSNIREVVTGSTVEFTSRTGVRVRGTVKKVNRKTVEVVSRPDGNSLFSTTYRVPASMLTVV